METTVKLYTLGYSRVKTYVTALLFVAGNIVLPQLFHLVPQGGVTWLPIYFFTLVGAYKYGWKAGLLTAVLSPLLNSWWFGMPAPAVLPAILLKSVLLAVGAGESHPAVAAGRGAVLSGGRYAGRVDALRQPVHCLAGFPYRHSRHAAASAGRLLAHLPCAEEIRRLLRAFDTRGKTPLRLGSNGLAFYLKCPCV